MGHFRIKVGRKGKKGKLAGGLTAAALFTLLLATFLPVGLVPSASSAALAELLARSPGERLAAIALKAKQRRAAAAPVAANEGPPRNAFASVLGASAGPENAVPGAVPENLGGFPSDFLAPEAPLSVPLSPLTDSSVVPGLPGSPFAPLPPLLPPLPDIGGTSPVVGVPEPATWLMLILGFGIIGHAGRRRTRASFA